MTRLMIKFFLA